MKFGVTYSRKVRAPQPYEMLEIGTYIECDDSEKTILEAYEEARASVNLWIKEEFNRLAPEPAAPTRRIPAID